MSLLSQLQGILAASAIGGAGGKSNPLPAIPDGRVDWGQNESFNGRNTIIPYSGGDAAQFGTMVGRRPPPMKATVAGQNPYPPGSPEHEMYNTDAANRVR